MAINNPPGATAQLAGVSTALLVCYVELVKLLTEKGALAPGEMADRLVEVSRSLAESHDPEGAIRVLDIISRAVRNTQNGG